jgi:hypothetical protein
MRNTRGLRINNPYGPRVVQEGIMGKTVGFIGWVSVILTIVSLVFTISTSHQIQYVEYQFYSYNMLQWCLFFTMLVWSINLFKSNTGRMKFVYSGICILFAFGAILFMRLGVN